MYSFSAVIKYFQHRTYKISNVILIERKLHNFNFNLMKLKVEHIFNYSKKSRKNVTFLYIFICIYSLFLFMLLNEVVEYI